jgi:hypothetical protein
MSPAQGPAAAFRWLSGAFDLLRRKPAALFGAGAVLVAFALLPSLLQMATQRVSPTAGAWLQWPFTLLGLVLMPPVLGGFYRMLRTLDGGSEPPVGTLWSVFSETQTARRLVACNLLFVVVTLAALVALAFALGGQDVLEYMRALSTMKPDATPADMPPMPDGMLSLVGMMLLVGLFVTTAQQLAAAHIALAGVGVGEASRFGAMGALRNALAFALLYAVLMLLGVVATGIAVAVIGLVFVALAVLSKALAVLVVGALMVGLLTGLYALMLAFFYCAWRALSGAGVPNADAAAPPPPPSVIAA